MKFHGFHGFHWFHGFGLALRSGGEMVMPRARLALALNFP